MSLANHKVLMNKRTLSRVIGGPRTANCYQFGAIFFPHRIQRCSLICMGPCQLCMKYLTYTAYFFLSFPNSPGSPYGFSQRAVFLNFNLFSGAINLIFFLILKISRNLYHNFYRHKKYSSISYSLGTMLSRSLMN